MPFLQTTNSVVKPATSVNPDNAMMKYEKKPATGLVKNAVLKIERLRGEAMEGIEFSEAFSNKKSPTSSQEVSPTESGTVTPRPRLTIAPCPVRLTPFHPPKNFGAVEPGTIYRSGFPEPHNVEFLECLNLRTILTLVETEAEPEIEICASLYDIRRIVVPINANKEGEVRATHDSLCEAILIAMNPTNYPLQIHCNRGKHRTGCIVACLRKIQRWPIEEVLAEYDTYASPKARPEDIELIKAFDPASVYEYAKAQGYVEGWPRESRADSATDIWELAAALPPHFLTPSTASEVSVDEDLMMSGAFVDPAAITYSLGTESVKSTSDDSSDESGTEVTVAELEDISME